MTNDREPGWEILVQKTIRAPDGLYYVVALPPDYWGCLETIIDAAWSTLDKIITMAWNGQDANKQQGVRSDFSFCLACSIFECHEQYQYNINGYSNDNNLG